GFGLVFLEAMAQSLPIIATRVSSIPEVIADGETGILVPPENAEALATVIRELLDHPEKMPQMGAAGRERLESVFSRQRMIDRTTALYRRITDSSS
ncbi:MAG TPA: glycosyltransferase family 4 protein, partial [Aggregatilineales bacterium]|nr:glycosyltransferase family 4 protein [Aggregatilineales bacterium]